MPERKWNLPKPKKFVFIIHEYSLEYLNEALEISNRIDELRGERGHKKAIKANGERLNYIFNQLLPNANTIPNRLIKKGRSKEQTENIVQAVEFLKAIRYRNNERLKGLFFKYLILACPLELKDRPA